MAILTSSDYPAIRAALDVTLDSTLLPDAVVGLSIYVGAANLEIVRRDPDAESRTGDEATHVTNAAVYLCASLIAPALPQITQETIGESSYRRQNVDVQALARDLAARADEELQRVIATDPETASRPTTFAVAIGERGR